MHTANGAVILILNVRAQRAAAAIGSGPASERLATARLWGESAALHLMWAEAEDGFAAAVGLLPLAAWPGLRRRMREHVLTRGEGLASDAAACAVINDHPGRGVELLERGRTVLWSQLLQLRGDIDDLRRDHADMAARLEAIRAMLDAPEVATSYHTLLGVRPAPASLGVTGAGYPARPTVLASG